MAERELAILLTARNLASRHVDSLNRSVGGLQKRTGTLQRSLQSVGKGLRTAFHSAALIGAAGLAFLAVQVRAGITSLAELQKVEAQTTAVIESTGGAAGMTGKEVRKLAEELEDLTTIDDKTVQAAENMLLTFTEIGEEVFPDATKTVLDMSTALGTDATQAAMMLGKALNDPTRGMSALRRVGVTFTKDQEKQIRTLQESGRTMEAQQVILKELNREFGGSAAAAADTYEGKMRRVEDAIEGAQMALATAFLPAIEKVASRFGKFLSDPAVIRRIEEFGTTLAGAINDQNIGRLEEGIDAAGTALEGVDWKVVGDALKVGGQGAKAIVDAFANMPPQAQASILALAGLNKLTGGTIGTIVSELGKGLIKGVLGINAGVVNVSGGVVNAGAGGVSAGGGLAGMLAIGATVTGLGIAFHEIGVAANRNNQLAEQGLTKAERQAIILSGLDATGRMNAAKSGAILAENRTQVGYLANLRSAQEKLRLATDAQTVEERSGLQRAREAVITKGEQVRMAAEGAGRQAFAGGRVAADAIIRKNMSTTVTIGPTNVTSIFNVSGELVARTIQGYFHQPVRVS